MDWRLLFLLAVVQGITEFLPISSDGHLAVVEGLHQQQTGHVLPNALGVNIVLHAGTLLAILVWYGRPLWQALVGNRRVLALLVVGTIPAVVVGLPLHQANPSFLTDPFLAGWMLLATGLLVWAASRWPAGEADYDQLTFSQALLIGTLQAVAILPGVSRSGSTIFGGLVSGLKREAAATFSFLLAIPTIGGACLLEGIKLWRQPPGVPLPSLAWAAGVSFVVGLLALKWLLSWLQRGRLQYFAYWCLVLGLVVIVWQWNR